MNASQTLHPTDQTLHAYGLGKLDDASAESVSQHVESCSDCQRRVAELSSDSFLGRLREAQGRPDSPAAVMSSNEGLSVLSAGPFSPAPLAASTLPPGLADHGDYEIVRELGRGGMGVVYLARNTIMGRMEVLKVVGSHLINRRGVLDRFLAEIRNAAKLDHPNIVTAYSVLRVDESLVLAMQYVEGLDLAQMVKARGPLPVAQACNYVHQAALGLQHAHEQGMVHRDIKPSNLMLTRQGNRALIKVLDFGLAKVQSERAVDGGLTHEGQMLGTPDYVAPEQISDARRADIRADIYSLGCTLYYLLTGGPPFRGTSLYDILQAHHSMDARPLNLARPEVPVELAALVAKMMAKEPERRFQEPRDVAQALTPFFKKGSAASAGSRPEFSQAGRPDANQATARAGSVPGPPAPELASAAGISLRKPVETVPPEVLWETLVEVRETERPTDARLATHSNRHPAWLWPAVAAAVLLVGFLAAWWGTGSLRIKTAEGFIVLEDLPDQSAVLVDGKKATVHWPDGGGPAEITVATGDHEVQVKKDGFTMRGQKMTIESGGRKVLTVRLEPLASPPAKKGDVDDGSARPVAAKPPVPPAKGTVVTMSPTPRTSATANPNTQPTVIAGSQPARLEAAGPDANKPAPTQAINAELALKGKADFLSGRWMMDGMELVQTDATRNYEPGVMFGELDWTDYEFTVDLMREKGSDCVLLHVRRTDKNRNLLDFEISAGKREHEDCRITVYTDGKERNLGGDRFRLVDHKWYTARVHVRANHIECTLHDGENEVVRVEAYDDDHPRGQVGLGTVRSSYRFKNIKVKALDGKTLWEMPPAIGGVPGHSGRTVAVASDAFGGPDRALAGKPPVSPAGGRTGTVPAQAQAIDPVRSPTQKASILSGSWRVENNDLVQTGGEGTILLGDAPLSSFDMSFKGQIVSGNEGFVALFHRTSGDNVRFFHVGELGGTRVDLGFLCEGKEGGQSKPIATVKGRWYNVLVKVRGSEFWCDLDGQELFHDVDERFARGRIGLATWDANARYRDIVVKTPDGKVVWSGMPDLPGRKAGEHNAPDSAAEGPARPQTREAARSPLRTAQVAAGKWRVEGNELIKTDANEPGEIRFGDPSWSRYDLTFKVIGIEGLAAYNTKFHYKSSRDQCLLEIGDDRVKNITYFYYLHKDKASEILNRRYPIELGRAYDVRLIVRGPVVTTYVDGNEWFDNVQVPLTEGRIGFATAGTSARYRDIAITNPEGKPLWIGPPNRLVDGEGKVLWEAPTD